MLATATALTLLVGLRLASAAPAPDGDPFVVNTYLTGSQFQAAASGLAGGGFVIVWEDRPDGSQAPADVAARLFEGDGTPIGNDFIVNAYTTGTQIDTRVVGLAGGNFVVVWRDYTDGDGSGISGRILDPAGVPVGGDFRVNAYTTDAQFFPAVDATADGGFVVVWTSRKPEFAAIRPQIFGRRFDQSGQAVGGEFQISETSFAVSRQYNPRLSALADGFVVVWEAQGPGVLARLLAADATPAGSQFPIPDSSVFTSGRPSVAPRPSSGFVVVWHTTDLDGDGFGVFGKRFDAGGSLVGSEFQINTVTTGNQDFAEIAADADGSFTVAFRTNPNDGGASGAESMARCYDAQGLPEGSELMVNVITTDSQNFPRIARIGPGAFVVAWQDQLDDPYGSANVAARMLRGGPAVLCGDANGDGNRTATDALLTLLTGVGAGSCPACICDVFAMNGINATDGLVILQFSVGQNVTLDCPSPC